MIRKPFDPLSIIPSPDTVREKLAETLTLAERLRLLLELAERLQVPVTGAAPPSGRFAVKAVARD